MAKKTPLSDRENKEIDRYFNTNITKATLLKRILNINPDRSPETILRTIRKRESDGQTKNNDRLYKKLRVGYLDIETSDLSADNGYMLSWCIKEKGKNKIYSDIITQKEIISLTFDKRITISLLETINKCFDVLYVYYGGDRRFDIPFIRSRAYFNDVEHLMPNKEEKYIIDIHPLAKSKLRLNYYSLHNVSVVLKTDNGKTKPKKWTWVCARIGNKQALNEIFLHNKYDVIVLEEVHDKLLQLEKIIYRTM